MVCFYCKQKGDLYDVTGNNDKLELCKYHGKQLVSEIVDRL